MKTRLLPIALLLGMVIPTTAALAEPLPAGNAFMPAGNAPLPAGTAQCLLVPGTETQACIYVEPPVGNTNPVSVTSQFAGLFEGYVPIFQPDGSTVANYLVIETQLDNTSLITLFSDPQPSQIAGLNRLPAYAADLTTVLSDAQLSEINQPIVFWLDESFGTGPLFDQHSVYTNFVPEPDTLVLFSLGLAGLAAFRRHRKI